MRGRDIAARLGIPFLDMRGLLNQKFGTLVICKYWPKEIDRIRDNCERLILDPLDCWCQTRPAMPVVEFWRWVQASTRCDAMIATTPSCRDAMTTAGVQPLYAPHHADERIGRDWYKPDGPVVYAGGARYLGDEREAIAAACERLGRRFVVDDSKDAWKSLQGAALTLCVRFGDERTPLNVTCKPGVKLANAARAGIPVLATNDAAVLSLCPGVTTVSGDWAADISAAQQSAPPAIAHGMEPYTNLLREWR
jgi:hypothetical protein